MIYIDRIEVVNKLAPYAGIFLSCFNKQHCDCFHSSSSSSVLVCSTASFFSVLVPLWFLVLSFMFMSASFSKSHRFAEMTISSKTASPLNYLGMLGCLWQVLEQSCFLELKRRETCETQHTQQSSQLLASSTAETITKAKPMQEPLTVFHQLPNPKTQTAFLQQHSLKQNSCVTEVFFMLQL